MTTGYLAVVLHGHLPFVYHPEMPEALEERWLFEALTECYLPLLNNFNALQKDNIPFRVTFSFSPTLLTMLSNPLLQERYLDHLDKSITLAHLEQRRLQDDPQFKHLGDYYAQLLTGLKEQYIGYQGDITKPFQALQDAGYLELITTCATHGYLPLMHNQPSWRAQIQTAVELFNDSFGQSPVGMWLPECAYAPGVDEMLREYHINYFFVDSHGLSNSKPSPLLGTYAPVCTANQVAAFGRDPASSRQVWDRNSGYPGDPLYREFYRDIGYDLPLDYLAPFLPGDHLRVDTGLKYHRITGNVDYKEPYQPDKAQARASQHAKDFIQQRCRQLELAASTMQRKPLAVAPYDAELFGHWWFEGPAWLGYLCREAAAEDALRLVTPGDYLREYPENQLVDLPMCSWGAGGYNQFWLNPSNDWIYKHLHHAEDTMNELADDHPKAQGLTARCLNQAARELLLAQSSDWPFIIHSGTAMDYAQRRFTDHIGRFNLLYRMIKEELIDETLLEQMEQRAPFLPRLDYHLYCSHNLNKRPAMTKSSYRILMLSWEYPPKTVGGLARHVHDLSCALAALGDEVHVLTCPAEGRGDYDFEEGVHIHRIDPSLLASENFMEWVSQLNHGMIKLAEQLSKRYGPFDLVHAHDWLVGEAGHYLVDAMSLPLVATIHATEYGRNHGLHSDLQRYIHSQEYELAARAILLIGCSHYMGHEISRLFNQPMDKIIVIPNGVDPKSIMPDRKRRLAQNTAEKNIMFLGRLVPEKGVQVLIRALPEVLAKSGPVRLFIAGKGPYTEKLAQLAKDNNVDGQVEFVGFVNDHERNELLDRCEMAVIPSLYEPFGIAALEAMAAGLTVIVSDTGGLKDVVEHGIDGYVSPPGDTGMLAHYISRLLNNPELARHFSKQALRSVTVKFNWLQIASNTLEVYAKAIKAERKER